MTPIQRVPVIRRRPAGTAAAVVFILALVAVFAAVHATRRAADSAMAAGPANAEAFSLDFARIGPRMILLAGHLGPLEVRRGASVVIEGWAVDTGRGRPSAAVFGTIAAQTFRARSDLARPDVARVLANPGYATAGFRLTISTRDLSVGDHPLVLYGTDATGHGRRPLGSGIHVLVVR